MTETTRRRFLGALGAGAVALELGFKPKPVKVIGKPLKKENLSGVYITLEKAPGVRLYEKSIQPPSIRRDDAVKTTNYNTRHGYKTKTHHTSIIELKVVVVLPGKYCGLIIKHVNNSQKITTHSADGYTLTFDGCISSVDGKRRRLS